MAIIVLRGDDDPPLTVVRVTGPDPEGQLRGWLSDHPISGTLELALDPSSKMRRSAVERIADEFGLEIRRHGEGGQERVKLT
jgi:hypothetical protein